MQAKAGLPRGVLVRPTMCVCVCVSYHGPSRHRSCLPQGARCFHTPSSSDGERYCFVIVFRPPSRATQSRRAAPASMGCPCTTHVALPQDPFHRCQCSRRQDDHYGDGHRRCITALHRPPPRSHPPCARWTRVHTVCTTRVQCMLGVRAPNEWGSCPDHLYTHSRYDANKHPWERSGCVSTASTPFLPAG